ncbi:MAG: hypothetical protein R3F61_34090 [Myxococcota bacterium]
MPRGFDHPAFDGPHVNPRALGLVQLSTLSEATWAGRIVFHPHEQRGDEPIWASPDGYAYDVGMALTHYADPDFGDAEPPRVRFVVANGATLQYASTNLWTPAP